MGLIISGDSFDDIVYKVKKSVQNIDTAIKFNLVVIGGKGTVHAKEHGAYKDQTKVLRNSIGYALVEQGSITKSQYKNEEARKAIQDFSASEDAVTLIIVAGANYARYVENKGYNVLSMTELYLNTELEKMISKTLKQAGF